MKKKILISQILFFVFHLFLFSQEIESTVSFSGLRWFLKESYKPTGPGPNRFSTDSIEIQPDGISLMISKKRKHWFSAELYTRDSFSYGSYTLSFLLPERLDSQAVFGFFLYNENSPPNFNEIDFEAARWGLPHNHPFSFSVQPYEIPGNTFSFWAPEKGDYTCRIVWNPDVITFYLMDHENDILAHWQYRGEDIPSHTDARVHLNLWLFEGNPPVGDGSLKVVIRSFSYEPFY